MPEMYQSLAGLYDQIQEIDLAAWADYIQQLDRTYRHVAPGTIFRGDGRQGQPLLLDLGCGTGSFCLEMVSRGYDPIGIDRSAAMLDQARAKMHRLEASGEPPPCLFIQQDIDRFELFGTVDLAVCLLDTVNHLTRSDQVRRLFRLVRNYLNPGCLMIFDLATKRHLSQSLGGQLFFYDYPEYTVFWQNQYLKPRQLSRSELTLFVRQPDGQYQRSDELIEERYYDLRQIRGWAAAAGLDYVGSFGELSYEKPRQTAERVFVVLRRPLEGAAAQEPGPAAAAAEP